MTICCFVLTSENIRDGEEEDERALEYKELYIYIYKERKQVHTHVVFSLFLFRGFE